MINSVMRGEEHRIGELRMKAEEKRRKSVLSIGSWHREVRLPLPGMWKTILFR